MSMSIALSLILTSATLIGVFLSPAWQGAGGAIAPLKSCRSLLSLISATLARFLVRLFGQRVETPPANVSRAFHRGDDLVVLSVDDGGRRLLWSA